MYTFARKLNTIPRAKHASRANARPALCAERHDVHPFLQLKAAIENQGVQRFLRTTSEGAEVVSTVRGTTGFGHDFSRIPVLSRERRIEPKSQTLAKAAQAALSGHRPLPGLAPAASRSYRTLALPSLRLAAALGPEGDPIHDVLVEQFRRERGLPVFPQRASDAEIKYQLALGAARRPAPQSVVYVSFVNDRPPSAPDHSQANPGPSGSGANRAGYSQATITKRMTIAWEIGAPTPGGRVPLYVRSVNVFFRLTNLQLFVSSDYPVGSCPYQVTLEHERSHIAAFLRIFDAGREPVVRGLEDVPLPTASAPTLAVPAALEAEQDAVADRLKAVVVANSSAIKAAQDADRAAKDSPAAYAAVYSRCPANVW